MTRLKFATLKLSVVCAMGLGASAMVPAAAAAAAGPYQAEATLATAVQSATDKDVDGVTWRCEGDKCVGKAERRTLAGLLYEGMPQGGGGVSAS